MKIGVLYPRSNTYPGISLDFMDAMKLFLTQQGLDDRAQFFSESIGVGGSEKEVYEKAEKLLLLDGVDVLIAYIDLKVTDLLAPLLHASGKLMIVVNPGANYPVNWIPQPTIVYLTLNHAFLCWLSGAQAAMQKNARAVMSTTFYDCGYLHTAAITKSFMLRGGTVMYNDVNKDRYDETFDINPLSAFLASDPATDRLLCIFDALPARLLYQRLNAYPGASGLKLYVSPMMLEEIALRDMGAGFAFSIDGYSPWLASVNNKVNQDFIDYYKQQTKRAPSVFSLLGWETGMILQQVLSYASDHSTEGIQLVKHLVDSKMNGPRGALQLDEQTNYFLSPVYKCSVRQNQAQPDIEMIDHPSLEWKAFIEEPTEGLVSGWTNTYLCY